MITIGIQVKAVRVFIGYYFGFSESKQNVECGMNWPPCGTLLLARAGGSRAWCRAAGQSGMLRPVGRGEADCVSRDGDAGEGHAALEERRGVQPSQ